MNKRLTTLQKAAEAVSAITPGLDYLIANAGLVATWSAFDPFNVLGQDPTRLTNELNELFNTNVVGQIHLINLFMPLILKGKVKKVIALTTGFADLDLTTKYGLYEAGPYAISKAALNMAIAKFQAEWQNEGVLLMSVAPGAVDVGKVAQSMLLPSVLFPLTMHA
jgi:NAD(P)-dependent dehydrogenase (short-subunit alcohol dehydrogenase family)